MPDLVRPALCDLGAARDGAGPRPSVFDRMRTQLMGGQFLDVMESARGWERQSTEQQIARARRVIRYKSAGYTIEHPLLIGAAAAGVSGFDLRRPRLRGSTSVRGLPARGRPAGCLRGPQPRQATPPATTCVRESARFLVALALDPGEPRQTRHCSTLCSARRAWTRKASTSSAMRSRPAVPPPTASER